MDSYRIVEKVNCFDESRFCIEKLGKYKDTWEYVWGAKYSPPIFFCTYEEAYEYITNQYRNRYTDTMGTMEVTSKDVVREWVKHGNRYADTVRITEVTHEKCDDTQRGLTTMRHPQLNEPYEEFRCYLSDIIETHPELTQEEAEKVLGLIEGDVMSAIYNYVDYWATEVLTKRPQLKLDLHLQEVE